MDSAPIVLVAAIVFCLAWPKPGQVIESERKPWKDTDFVGSFLLIAAAVLTVFSFQNAASDPDQWSRATFLAPLLVGIACWAAFGIWESWAERRHAQAKSSVVPTWPAALLRHRVFAGAALNTAFTGFVFFTVIFTLPLRFQIVNARSSLMAGVLLLPLLGAAALGNALGSTANAKDNRLFETLFVGSAFSVLGCGLLTTLSSGQHLQAKTLGFSVFVGLGNGLVTAGVTTLAAIESSIRDQATAQGVIAQARVFGGSLGIAASSALLARKAVAAGSSLASFQHGTGGLPKAAARDLYAGAFRDDMFVGLGMAALALLSALAVFQKKRQSIMERRNAKIMQEVQRRSQKRQV